MQKPGQKNIEQRRKLHESGRGLLLKGENLKAIKVFKTALSKHGPHCDLLGDLCAAQYETGDLKSFQVSLVALKNEFVDSDQQLSAGSALKTRIRLSNFLENEGKLSEALALLKADADKTSECEPALFYRFLAERLRLSALLRLRDPSVYSDYSLLLDLAQMQPEIYALAEIQHALMIAECSFFSATAGLDRLKVNVKILADESERRLFLADFAEQLVYARADQLQTFRRDNSFNLLDAEEINWVISDLRLAVKTSSRTAARPEFDFELALLAALSDSGIRAAAKPKKLKRREVTAGSVSLQLRTLYAQYLSAPNSRSLRQIAHEIDQRLQPLDERSQKLWRKRFAALAAPDSLAMNWNPALETLTFEGRKASFKSRKAAARLLDLLKNDSVVPFAIAVENIWERPVDAVQLRKLSALITKLDRSFADLTGVDQLVTLSENAVNLSRRVQLQPN